MRRPVVGVMGASLNDALTDSDRSRIGRLAEELGASVAQAGCILMTGATTGIPHLVASAFRRHGGFALGVSPAENRREHVERYRLPDDGADAIIYTGFGFKGRNLINVRSSDIVLLIGGAIGTLNEFTIAYDEGKIVGVLDGSGGVSDHVQEIIQFCKKTTQAALFYDKDPAKLVERCVAALHAAPQGC